jgi:hypothetical protein
MSSHSAAYLATAADGAWLRSGPEGPGPNTSVAASRWLQIAPSDVTSVAAANAPRDFGTRALAPQLSGQAVRRTNRIGP